MYILKAKCLLELIFKYSPHSQHAFLRVHLSAVNGVLEEMELMESHSDAFKQMQTTLLTLLSLLSLYKIDTNVNAASASSSRLV